MPQTSPDIPDIESAASSRSSAGPLPFSNEAEQAVLGGLMLAGDQAFDNIASRVREDDFYRTEHKIIFQSMGRLAEKSLPFDPITLCDDLNSRRELNKAGGANYVSELAANTPSASNIEAYARIVREQATLRQLIGAASEILSQGHNPDGMEAGDLLSEAEKRFIDISEDRPRDEGFLSADDLLKQAIDRIEELYESDDNITGVTTGFEQLDEKTSGWQKADLVVVAARPSMGKTAFALNMVETALLSQTGPVLVFSLEMPAHALMMRMLSSLGKIPLKHIRDGNLTGDDWDRLAKAASKLKGRKLFIDDTPGLTPIEVRARTRRLAREQGENPALIMLDYIQLMHISGSNEGRTQEISEISRSLKQVAREFDCPLLALSQLNRGVEQRPNKRPMNSDLRESGAIEQDADVILFIYRDEYYNEESPDKGIAEIIIGKQRNGEIGTCRLQFQGEYTRFNNLAPEFRNPSE
eukprot:g16906.t1